MWLKRKDHERKDGEHLILGKCHAIASPDTVRALCHGAIKRLASTLATPIRRLFAPTTTALLNGVATEVEIGSNSNIDSPDLV
jgi:hypothetical protein